MRGSERMMCFIKCIIIYSRVHSTYISKHMHTQSHRKSDKGGLYWGGGKGLPPTHLSHFKKLGCWIIIIINVSADTGGTITATPTLPSCYHQHRHCQNTHEKNILNKYSARSYYIYSSCEHTL